MNKSDSLQQLIQIIHEQNAEYIAIFGLIVTIAGIFLGFTGYQQKKISDKQVAKFTEEIKKAQSLVSSLREGNAAVVQYSLENMAIDDKFQAHPTWKQKARMFIAVKKCLMIRYWTRINYKMI